MHGKLQIFTVESCSVTQSNRCFKRMLLKRETHVAYFNLYIYLFCRTIGSHKYFALPENNFRPLRQQSLNSKQQYSMAYGKIQPAVRVSNLFYIFFGHHFDEKNPGYP